MIQVPIPKEHPYQSHISRFALFPTFHSPDDPDTGVRAASRQPLNPLIPSSAPEVTVLSKTKGEDTQSNNQSLYLQSTIKHNFR